MTVNSTSRDASPTAHTFRPWWLWLATAFAFPIAGLAGRAAGGRVEDVASALLAGLAAGAVLGVGQWLVLRRRNVSFLWIVATSVGFAIGLAAGAATVSYQTDKASLVLMGAITGVAVGLFQGVAGRAGAVRTAVWAGVTAGLFALGWLATGGIGFPVAEQWPVFGMSGSLLTAFVQCLVIERILALPPRPSER